MCVHIRVTYYISDITDTKVSEKESTQRCFLLFWVIRYSYPTSLLRLREQNVNRLRLLSLLDLGSSPTLLSTRLLTTPSNPGQPLQKITARKSIIKTVNVVVTNI